MVKVSGSVCCQCVFPSEVEGPGSSPIQTGMSDEDSRASTSSSSSPPSSSQTRQRDTFCKKKRESKASMSKTSKLLSTSAKRIQKELADITLDPPPNCRWASLFDLKSVVCPLVYSLGEH
ncbi:ubiquitin-conjugating enzyme E2 E1-like [Notothenia coriiceps]|uniref:Ubiquitin-conjugating enzyme E2 E1-like n=1 Tax=Notothenia coriiceps TaxID=8208 RepID=A0A6I9NAS6_9TELE|nr:PREDICTED: ubiquitin-conjugating enzyme E2 E1-like [Notothenia coriiceps]